MRGGVTEVNNRAMRALLILLLLWTLFACGDGGPRPGPGASLHDLAQRGATRDLLAAVRTSGNVDERDVCYRTPLMFAAQFGRLDTVGELLASGARVNLHEKGLYSALMLAAGNGHTDVVRVLAEAGATLDDREITRGWTALIWAAQRGHQDTVALLLALGADPASRDEHGRTALDWALLGGHREVAALL